MCQHTTQPTQAMTSAIPSQAPASASGSWSETFAPKISSATITSLKAQFLKDYPSEVITGDTMPSTRLISQAHHNFKQNEIIQVDSVGIPH